MCELRLLICRLVISKSVKVASSLKKGGPYGTVRKYGTPQFLQKVWCTGTVHLFCNVTGTVRWYGTL